MDKVIVAVIELLAACYCFWQIYSTTKGKDAGRGCASCPFQFGKKHPDGIMCQSGNTGSKVSASDKDLRSEFRPL